MTASSARSAELTAGIRRGDASNDAGRRSHSANGPRRQLGRGGGTIFRRAADESADLAALHQFRIRGKALRYAIELVGPGVRTRAARRASIPSSKSCRNGSARSTIASPRGSESAAMERKTTRRLALRAVVERWLRQQDYGSTSELRRIPRLVDAERVVEALPSRADRASNRWRRQRRACRDRAYRRVRVELAERDAAVRDRRSPAGARYSSRAESRRHRSRPVCGVHCWMSSSW